MNDFDEARKELWMEGLVKRPGKRMTYDNEIFEVRFGAMYALQQKGFIQVDLTRLTMYKRHLEPID